MIIPVVLPETVETRLRSRASRAGMPVENYLARLAELDVASEGPPATPEKVYEKMLAPFHGGFEEGGMTEAELDALIEEARNGVWAERVKDGGTAR